MKSVIPLGAVLLVGIAAGIHPAFVGRALPDRRPPAGAVVRPRPPETEPLESVVGPVPVQGEVSQKSKPVEAIAVPLRKPKFSFQKMAAQLDRDLAFTEFQKAAVDQVLRDRVQEIQKCHDAIRQAGVLDVRHYEWQVGRMKESWFRRIDALLDALQHERFVALVEKGLFNEGLGFTEDPGMTVLE